MTEQAIEGEIVEEVDLPVASAPASKEVALVARDQIDVGELVQQSKTIEEAMRMAMTEGVHYGRIPGVDKPTLLKPGAEKLLVLFRLCPSYESEKIWHDDGHLTVMVKCLLYHIPSGLKIAEGEGLCTTKETRYAWRKGARVCPVCGEAAIIKGKREYGGGWLCFARKGGCGLKWDDASAEAHDFESMSLDRTPNPDLADSYNTVLKMADKRALLAAILNGTAASDVFTQDMEDSSRSTNRGNDRSDETTSSASRGQSESTNRRKPPTAAAAERSRKDRLGERIDQLLKEADVKREVDAGTTFNEAVAHYGKLTDLSEEQLEELGVNLSAYLLLEKQGMTILTFDAFCKDAVDIPFG